MQYKHVGNPEDFERISNTAHYEEAERLVRARLLYMPWEQAQDLRNWRGTGVVIRTRYDDTDIWRNPVVFEDEVATFDRGTLVSSGRRLHVMTYYGLNEDATAADMMLSFCADQASGSIFATRTILAEGGERPEFMKYPGYDLPNQQSEEKWRALEELLRTGRIEHVPGQVPLGEAC